MRNWTPDEEVREWSWGKSGRRLPEFVITVLAVVSALGLRFAVALGFITACLIAVGIIATAG